VSIVRQAVVRGGYGLLVNKESGYVYGEYKHDRLWKLTTVLAFVTGLLTGVLCVAMYIDWRLP
jgi:hypothetical protein